MRPFYFFTILVVIFSGCNNLEDVERTERRTFIRFYESANQLSGVVAEQTSDGGFIIGANVVVTGDNRKSSIVLMKTDKLGEPELEPLTIENASISSLIVTNDGYLIVGDSVVFNANSSTISEITNTSARLIRVKTNLDPNDVIDISYAQVIEGDPADDTDDLHIDYTGTAITQDDSQNLIILGTRKVPGEEESAIITVLSPALDTLWYEQFNYLNRDYANVRSLYYNAGDILWGASITETTNNFTRSYVAIPKVKLNSTFSNSNYFGQTLEQVDLSISDLRKGASGFGAVGTYSGSDGTKSNILFIKVDAAGNFIESTERYFDGELSMSATAVDATTSNVQDVGNAITSTPDGGFVIAGSTINSQNGNYDVILIKVDASGDPKWTRVIGGRGSEVPVSIRSTADNGLIICGTIQDGINQSSGIASVFLIKTDSNGEIKN